MSKRSERQKKYEAIRKKQLDIAYKYPFCRRCKEPLKPAWAKKLKKAGSIPLCKKCYKPMMSQFIALQEAWRKFRAR